MQAQIRSFMPQLFVQNMQASLAFYEKLGFSVANSFTPQGADVPSWCWMRSERSELMLGTATKLIDAAAQGVLFYGYATDVSATRDELISVGLEVGPITKPFYNPGGEFEIRDPDGYVIWIAQI